MYMYVYLYMYMHMYIYIRTCVSRPAAARPCTHAYTHPYTYI